MLSKCERTRGFPRSGGLKPPLPGSRDTPGIRCPNSVDAWLAALRVSSGYENFELSNRSDSHGDCRDSSPRGGSGRGRPRLRHGGFPERISLPALPPLGGARRTHDPVSLRGHRARPPLFGKRANFRPRGTVCTLHRDARISAGVSKRPRAPRLQLATRHHCRRSGERRRARSCD